MTALPPPVRVADVPRAVAEMLNADPASWCSPERFNLELPIDAVPDECPPDPEMWPRWPAFTDLDRFERPFLQGQKQARIGVFLPHRLYSPMSPWRPKYNPYRQQQVRVAVAVSVEGDPEGLQHSDFLGRIGDIHDQVHRLLHWKSIPTGEDDVLRGHETALPLMFLGYAQDTAQHIEKFQGWFMAAEYKTVLRRIAE